jgi:hypothetical protein
MEMTGAWIETEATVACVIADTGATADGAREDVTEEDDDTDDAAEETTADEVVEAEIDASTPGSCSSFPSVTVDETDEDDTFAEETTSEDWAEIDDDADDAPSTPGSSSSSSTTGCTSRFFTTRFDFERCSTTLILSTHDKLNETQEMGET